MHLVSQLAETIANQGKALYVYPGGTIAPLIAACHTANVECVCAKSEQGAGYMAIADATLTGKPAFVAVTSGPGATNIVTCVADAFFDGVPLVVLAGQVGVADLERPEELRQRGFQEVRFPDIVREVTKAVFQPRSPGELRDAALQCVPTAMAGRPGPVVLDLPMNVQMASPDGDPTIGRREKTLESDVIENAPIEAIQDVLGLLECAERPLVLAGAGALCNASRVRELATAFNLPVVSSLRGIGVLPDEDPLNAGWIGHTGLPWANWALAQADFLLVLGSRLDVRQTGTELHVFKGKTVVRVDIDPAELAHSRVPHAHAYLCDAGRFIDELLAAAPRGPRAERESWLSKICEARKRLPLSDYGDDPGVRPDQLFGIIDVLVGDRSTIVTTGVGCHQQWAARHLSFDYPHKRLFTSSGHGTMGFALPTAIGVRRLSRDRLVLCIDGDGSFQMNIQELALVRELDLDLKILVADNRRLALVSQFQQIAFGQDPVTGDFAGPDFSAIGRAYGIRSLRMDSLDRELIGEWINAPGPCLLHVSIQHDAPVSPMLLAGQPLDSMWSRS